jgi:U3 small nucleolar RNA-associated protein 14
MGGLMARKSKERKRIKKIKSKEVVKINKIKKEKKKANKQKLEAHANLPQSEWSEVRKKYLGIE